MPPKPTPQPQRTSTSTKPGATPKPSRPGTGRPPSSVEPQRPSIRSVLKPAQPARQASDVSSFYAIRRNVSPRYSVVSALPTEQWVVIPPDGGWGWIVVVAAFIINFLIDGTTYCFGIFLNDISSSFEVHPTKIAIANSLMSGFYYFAGPLSCALCNRFGFRIVGITGALMSGLVFVYASFCYNLTIFLIVVGFCGGVAFNMVYTPTILVCGFYFERYRALATAISVTGTSIGIMAFPIIVNNLFHDMEWRMEFRLLAGSFGMIVLLVLTFRPIRPTKVVTKKAVSTADFSSEDEEDSIGSFNLEDLPDDKGAFTLKKIFQNFHNKFFPTMVSERDSVATSESKVSKSVRSAYFGLPGAMASESSFTRSVFREGVPDTRSAGLSTVYETDDDDKFCCCCCHCCRCCKICRCKRHFCEDDFNRPLYRDDIFFTGSIKTLPEYRSVVTVAPQPSVRSSRAVKERASVNYTLSVSRVVTQREMMESRRCVCCPEAVLRVLSTMLDLKLMKQLSFTLVVISGFLTMVGLYSPFVFIGQRGEELGFRDNWNTLLLTIMGISNTVGRIVCGIVSTIPHVDVMLISWITLLIAGVATIASAFIPILEAQIAFSVTFGVTMASFTALRAALIAEMVGLENLTNAFGITIMFYGLGSFVGIPLSSVLQNLTGKYGYSFLFAGSAILLSGVIMIPIRKIIAWEARKKKKVTFI